MVNRNKQNDIQSQKTGQLPTIKSRYDLKIEDVDKKVANKSFFKRFKKSFIVIGLLLGFILSISLGFYISSSYNEYKQALNEQVLKQNQLKKQKDELQNNKFQLENEAKTLEKEKNRLFFLKEQKENESTKSSDIFQQILDEITGDRQKREETKKIELITIQRKIDNIEQGLNTVKEKINKINELEAKITTMQNNLQKAYQDNKTFIDALKTKIDNFLATIIQ